MRIKHGDVELDVEVLGTGTPMLLVMGIAAQRIFWPNEFLQQLVDRGFQVITFDNRDVGGSTYLKAAGTPKLGSIIARRLLGARIEAPYTLSDMAGDAIAVLDHLGIPRAHIVGASMGGMIAQHIAIEHPDRVLSLTGIMTHGGDIASLLSHPRALRVFLGRRAQSREEYGQQIVDVYRTNAGRGYVFDEAGMRDLAGRAYDRGFNAAAFPRQLAAILASGSRYGRVERISARTLLVHGSDDPLVRPVGGRKLAAAIPGARFELIEGMGYDLPRPTWLKITSLIADHASAT